MKIEPIQEWNMKTRKLHLAISLTCLAAFAGPAQALDFARWDDVATVPNAEFPEAVEHLALLGRYDDGSQFIVVRTICKDCFGIDPGTRIGGDIVIDGNAVWGSGGTTMVDIGISAIPTPERDLTGPFGLQTPPRLVGLLDNGDIVDLLGVWGNGHISFPDITDWFPVPDQWDPIPGEWLVSATGLNFDTATCGNAAALSESSVHLTVIDADGVTAGDGLFPAFAVGTEKGCVGMAGFDNPLIAFIDPDNPGIYFDNPLIAFDNPLIAFEDPGVTFDNPLIAFDNPLIAFDNPLIAMAPVVRDTSGGHSGGYGVAISTGDKLTSLDTGRWSYDESGPGIVHAVSDSTFRTNFIEAGIPSGTGESFIASAGIAYSSGNEIIVPGGTFLGSPVVASDGTGDLRVGIMPGDNVTITFDPLDEVSLSTPVGRIALGSLLAITPDGQDVVFVSDFDPINLPGAGTVDEISVGGIQSVAVGPRTFSLGAKGKNVTAVIEAQGMDAASINADSVRLSVGGLDPTPSLAPLRTNLVDRDHDGNLELVTKFSRSELGALLAQLHPENDHAGLLLSWETLIDSCGEDFDEPCPGSYPTVIRIID
jgi:hypothetical protein